MANPAIINRANGSGFVADRIQEWIADRPTLSRGLCLPSGSSLSEEELERVAEAVLECAR